jgi:hypothetical protein
MNTNLIKSLQSAKKEGISIGECWNRMDAAADLLEAQATHIKGSALNYVSLFGDLQQALEQIEALQADLIDERNRGLALLEDAKHWQAELAKAEADKSYLQADVARLEHLCKSVRCASANIDGKHSWNFLYGHGWTVGATFREAIDAAIAAKGNV